MGDRSLNAQRLKPCMPPLMEEEVKFPSREDGFTNFRGTACESIVKSYFLSQNINIAEPHVDHGVDILIERPEGWVRGQVKKVVYDIYRSRFNFNFQGGSRASHLKRRQRGPETIDYFYHVLLTQYRQLIWETPVKIIPLRENGTFIHGKNPVIDRNNWIRKKPDIDYNKMLISSKYEPIIFKTYPEFFLKEETTTLDEFFDYEQ